MTGPGAVPSPDRRERPMAVDRIRVVLCDACRVSLIVYTDGACSGNPGPGGWAWAAVDGGWASGADVHTTNQRMEITAAFEAVRAHPGPLEIVSDSTYVVHCFRDRWHEGWRRRGWRNSQRQPVANRDLWEPFIDLVLGRGDVTFRWVKGHGGDPMNDLVDRLAVAAATSRAGASGDRPPSDPGPADTFGTGETARGIVDGADLTDATDPGVDTGTGSDPDGPVEPPSQGVLF